MSEQFYDVELATDATSDFFMTTGYVDFWIIGLLAGSVKVQVKFKASEVEDPTTWRDLPDGSFTTDTAKTFFVGEDQVLMRVVGSSNTDGVYVRFGRA